VITVACVLRSGNVYTPEWVDALQKGVTRYLSEPFSFCALSDLPGFEPLRERWPRWWAKLELFRPGLFTGPVLYLDLDTVVVGDLGDLARYAGAFAMLSSFYRPLLAQSGVMAWNPGPETAALWETFSEAPDWWMRHYYGDGDFLHAHAKPERLQELFPGQIVSYKKHARQGPPDGARVVCFHGQPRPHEAPGWVAATWGR
jgi:hypothetical protein